MAVRCPVCKVENVAPPTCRRCKADLSMLFALEKRRDALLAMTRASLAAGAWREALQASLTANSLRQDEESLELVTVAALLNRDYELTWRMYQRKRLLETG